MFTSKRHSVFYSGSRVASTVRQVDRLDPRSNCNEELLISLISLARAPFYFYPKSKLQETTFKPAGHPRDPVRVRERTRAYGGVRTARHTTRRSAARLTVHPQILSTNNSSHPPSAPSSSLSIHPKRVPPRPVHIPCTPTEARRREPASGAPAASSSSSDSMRRRRRQSETTRSLQLPDDASRVRAGMDEEETTRRRRRGVYDRRQSPPRGVGQEQERPSTSFFSLGDDDVATATRRRPWAVGG